MRLKRLFLILVTLISFSYASYDGKIGVDKQYLYDITSQEKIKVYTIDGAIVKIINRKGDSAFVEYNHKILGPIATHEDFSSLKEEYRNEAKREKRKQYLIKDDKVNILKKEGEWVYIEYKTKKKESIKGWIPFDSLAKIDYPMIDIFNSLDVTSFGSSIRPKISGVDKEIKLSKLKFLKGDEKREAPKVTIKNNTITIEDSDWFYKIEAMMKQGEDYHVCFQDRAVGSGTYDTQKPMVIRKKGDLYVAVDVDSDVCVKWAR